MLGAPTIATAGQMLIWSTLVFQDCSIVIRCKILINASFAAIAASKEKIMLSNTMLSPVHVHPQLHPCSITLPHDTKHVCMLIEHPHVAGAAVYFLLHCLRFLFAHHMHSKKGRGHKTLHMASCADYKGSPQHDWQQSPAVISAVPMWNC